MSETFQAALYQGTTGVAFFPNGTHMRGDFLQFFLWRNQTTPQQVGQRVLLPFSGQFLRTVGAAEPRIGDNFTLMGQLHPAFFTTQAGARQALLAAESAYQRRLADQYQRWQHHHTKKTPLWQQRLHQLTASWQQYQRRELTLAALQRAQLAVMQTTGPQSAAFGRFQQTQADMAAGYARQLAAVARPFMVVTLERLLHRDAVGPLINGFSYLRYEAKRQGDPEYLAAVFAHLQAQAVLMAQANYGEDQLLARFMPSD
ncbi:MAG: hypothetical protein LKJ69_00350 [Lactobacillus sp.]|jgi:hypothetical protein|nr:hypothetical protein [Lactobacillus sp.]MCI2031830.1 hypothetical protein [Lactobacillus sp.]